MIEFCKFMIIIEMDVCGNEETAYLASSSLKIAFTAAFANP
jgi:hypothetical protein